MKILKDNKFIYKDRSDYIIKNKKAIIVITILIITTILLLTPIVYAKYISTEISKSTLNIAQPIFEVEGNQSTKISETNNIGYYEFTIKNFNETCVSEIGFLYTIEIISDADESIEFELYNEEELVPLENLKTQQISINGKEKIEQKYKLKVTYDSTKVTQETDITKEVQVKVYSEQEKL